MATHRLLSEWGNFQFDFHQRIVRTGEDASKIRGLVRLFRLFQKGEELLQEFLVGRGAGIISLAGEEGIRADLIQLLGDFGCRITAVSPMRL